MADSPLPPRSVPAEVGVRNVEVILQLAADGKQSATYRIQVALTDGETDQRVGNLVPHLTNAEIAGLQTLINRIKAKAQSVWGSG